MPHPVATIAWYTLLEARRNRFGLLLAVLALAALGLAAFAGRLALTETGQIQVALAAALTRTGAVLLVCAYAITGMQREAADKGQQLLLAMPISRTTYLLGKLAGFFLLALIPALVFGAFALFAASTPAALVWAVSLLCESWIMLAFGVLCALGLRQPVPALAACCGFYVLARAIGSLQAMADGGLTGMAANGIAALVPHLDHFTQSAWLVYGDAGPAQLSAVLIQTALYVPLLAAAALFDLYRKDL